MSSLGDRAFVALQRVLPQHGLSRLVGRLAASELPLIRSTFIAAFSRAYRVDLSEAARTSPGAYRSFNDFFTRELKPRARPLAGDEDTAVCPADGTVSQAGVMHGDRLLQAKGHSYSLEALLADPVAAARYRGGAFATIYLAPRDYHRVHVPLAGDLVRSLSVPGALYSVNAATEAGIDGLFARNERLVCHFETAFGGIVVVLVGAMIVASIGTVWAGPTSPYTRLQATEHDRLAFERGQEIGRFFLGSTVIVCTEPDRAELAAGIEHGGGVRMGQALFAAR